MNEHVAVELQRGSTDLLVLNEFNGTTEGEPNFRESALFQSKRGVTFFRGKLQRFMSELFIAFFVYEHNLAPHLFVFLFH